MAKYSDHTNADEKAAVLTAFSTKCNSQYLATCEALNAQKQMLQMKVSPAIWEAPFRSPRPRRRLYLAASAAPPSIEMNVKNTIAGNTAGVPGWTGDAEA
jgi:hypothetical protein